MHKDVEIRLKEKLEEKSSIFEQQWFARNISTHLRSTFDLEKLGSHPLLLFQITENCQLGRFSQY